MQSRARLILLQTELGFKICFYIFTSFICIKYENIKIIFPYKTVVGIFIPVNLTCISKTHFFSDHVFKNYQYFKLIALTIKVPVTYIRPFPQILVFLPHFLLQNKLELFKRYQNMFHIFGCLILGIFCFFCWIYFCR